MPYNNYGYPPNVTSPPPNVGYNSNNNSLPRPDPKVNILKDVRDKVNKDVEVIIKELNDNLENLLEDNKKLLENEKKITNSIALFEQESLRIKNNVQVFENKNKEIEQKVEELSKTEIVPDEILILTPLMNQLVEVVAEESTIEDMIFYLGKALTSEQIDLTYYLKHIRALSREQFLKKVLIKKIRAQAQLV